MLPDTPSTTARRVARRRAAHQLLDRPPVLDDPLALQVLDADDRAAIAADPAHFEQSRIAPYLRAFFAARARLAEDELAAAVARGVTQYVVLGAGLDTFACRNPHSALVVYEADHPSTQAWKRARLAAAWLAPARLRFVPLELERTPLADALAAAGFDATRPAFAALLGVSMYLTRAALATTLRVASAWPAGSALVLDYAQPRPDGDPVGERVFDAMTARVEQAGEPWLTFFSRPELERELRANGFGTIEHFDRAALHARYFEGRADGLTVGRLASLVIARVG